MDDIQILKEIAYYSKFINQYKKQTWQNNSNMNDKILVKNQNSFNKYKYVKKDSTVIKPVQTDSKKVLINPNFKLNVHFNPHFNSQSKKIHLNPAVLNSEIPKKETETLPQSSNKLSNENIVLKRRNSIRSKYKIIKSNCLTPEKIIAKKNATINNKYKLDRRSINTITRSVAKKKIKRRSLSDVLRNQMFKNRTCKKTLLINNFKSNNTRLTNISGILYKKSQTKLQKVQPKSQKLVKRNSKLNLSCHKSNKNDRKTRISTPNKFIKSNISLNSSRKLKQRNSVRNKLRKNNQPCPVFQRYGKCRRKESGRCNFTHNHNQIFLCKKFLQGACVDNNCLLSHKVSPEKMPTCKYFLEGCCIRNDCPYLHVKINPKADICRNFLEGFCVKGTECNFRHQFLCPSFEKNGICEKRKCLFPHKSKEVFEKPKCKIITEKSRILPVETPPLVESARYYDDKTNNEQVKTETDTENNCTDFSSRPQLGSLPSFIPFN